MEPIERIILIEEKVEDLKKELQALKTELGCRRLPVDTPGMMDVKENLEDIAGMLHT